jgi:predicted nucleic acid-binding Zn finger protein
VPVLVLVPFVVGAADVVVVFIVVVKGLTPCSHVFALDLRLSCGRFTWSHQW